MKTSASKSSKPKSIGVYEKRPRYAGGREVLILKKEYIQLRNDFMQEIKLHELPLNSIPTRQWRNIGLFFIFLTKAKRDLYGPDLLLLPAQFAVWLKKRNHFTSRQIHLCLLDARRLIHYVLSVRMNSTKASETDSGKSHATPRPQDQTFIIGKPDGPREDIHLKIALRYHSYLPESAIAKSQFNLLYNSITEYLKERFQTRKAWNTYLAIENDLKVFLAYCAENHLWMPASSITKDIFISFLGSLRVKKLSKSTISRYAQNVMKFLVQVRGIDPHIATVEMPEKPKPNPDPMDSQTAIRLRSSMESPKGYKDIRDRSFLDVLGVGLRICEACSIEKSSVREIDGVPCLFISQDVSKNGIARNVPITPDTLLRLERLFKLNAQITRLPYAFLITRGKVRQATTTTMRRAYKSRAAASGITYRRWLRPHNQRSRFVVDCMDLGFGDSFITKVIGHADIRSLEHYRVFSDSAVIKELKSRHPAFISGMR